MHQRWEVTCLAASLLRTIKQKDGALTQKEDVVKVDEEGDGGLFNPDFKELEKLTPLMLKYVKAHECLCVSCHLELADNMSEQARIDAQTDYEESVSDRTKLELYESVMERFKGEAEALAREHMRDELRKGGRKEVVEEYESGLVADLEQ